MLRYSLLFIVLLASGGSALAAPHAQAADSAFERVACSTFKIASDEFRCGYVLVPEFHSQPNGRQLKLAVAVLPSTGATPTRDALVLAQGGPGGSTLDLFAQFLELEYYPAVRDLRAERDIVLYDQRGTLYSQPALTCPEELELTFRTIEQELSPAEELAQQEQAALACRARLAQAGVDFAAYNSIENALDVQDVRRALGYDRFDFYGISYGTLLALHAMRETPETFRSVALDAVVPAQINPNVTIAQSQQRAFKELFARCAADAACNRAFPALEPVLYALVDRLNAQPARVWVTDAETGKRYHAVIDGDTFLDLLFQFIYNSELVPALPKLIYDTRDGNYNLIEVYYPLVVFDRTFASGMYYSVMCAEDADFTLDELELDGVDPHIARAQERDTAAFLELCRKWDVPPLGATADQPVASNIPTLLFAGAFDPITPPPFAQAAAETISPSYLFVFSAYAHGALTSGNCPDRILAEFVRNPERPPDGECIRSVERVRFVTPDDYVFSPGIGRMQADMLQARVQSFLAPLVLLAIVLSVYIVGPLSWLIRHSQHRPSEPSRWARLAPWLAAAAGATAGLFFVLLFGIVIYESLRGEPTVALVVGTPRAFAFVLALPLLYAAIAFALGSAVITAWLGSPWRTLRRVYYSGVAAAAVGLGVWFLTQGILGALFGISDL